MLIRTLTPAHIPYVERMTLFAGFPPNRELPRDAAPMPHIRRLLDGWGRPGDVGVLAGDENGRKLGAAWARVLDQLLLHDDLGEPVAELAMAVEAAARASGVGAVLLDALAHEAAAAGHRELSLTVSPRNRAAELYLRAGFEIAGEGARGLIMRRRLG